MGIGGFRPLAGINCNTLTRSCRPADSSFRPLTEDNFTISHIDSKEKNHPQEKRGWSRNDKPSYHAAEYGGQVHEIYRNDGYELSLKAEVQRQAKKLLTSILKAKSFLQR